MKFIQFTAVLIMLFLMESCGSSRVRKSVTQEEISINKTTILTNPQIADLKIEERKIEGFVEVRKKDYSNPVEDAKSLAIRKATLDGKCDLVAQPNFEITESKEAVTVKVVGFAAHYKNFRPMVPGDTSAFVMYEQIRSERNSYNPIAKVTQQSNYSKNNNSVGSVVLKVLGGIILGLLGFFAIISMAYFISDF